MVNEDLGLFGEPDDYMYNPQTGRYLGKHEKSLVRPGYDEQDDENRDNHDNCDDHTSFKRTSTHALSSTEDAIPSLCTLPPSILFVIILKSCGISSQENVAVIISFGVELDLMFVACFVSVELGMIFVWFEE